MVIVRQLTSGVVALLLSGTSALAGALARLSQPGQAGGEFWDREGEKRESVQRWGFEFRL
jgi:hypothetical protein